MELIWWGDTVQDAQWKVEESSNCGFLRIYYVVSGLVAYGDKNGFQLLEPGCGYVFPSHAPYTIHHDPKVPFRCLWFHVNALPYILQKLICLPILEKGVFGQVFSLLDTLLQQPNPQGDSLSSCCQVLVEQLRRHDYFQRIDRQFYEIVEQLRKSAFAPLQIKQFAKEHGYTSEHFIRLFQQNMQQTPYQFVINCKMAEARILLRNGVSISEICETIGYSDVKNFDKAFKNKHGMTPTAYGKHALRTV